MKKKRLRIRPVLFCIFAFSTKTLFAHTDSTLKDKGKLLISAGIGVCSPDWVGNINIFKMNETISQPNFIYSSDVQYFIGKDIAVSIGGFYSNTTFRSRDHSSDNFYGVPSYVDYSIKYISSYKILGLTTECLIIYDRIYKTSRVLYCSAGIGYSWRTGTIETQITHYSPPLYTNNYQDISKDIVKGHLTLVGIRGGRTLCWYAELGYGYKGIVNAGFAVKL